MATAVVGTGFIGVVFEVDGSGGSVGWDSGRNEELWLGQRDRPNELLWREHGSVPPGRAVYRAVAAGEPGDDYPTFRDGPRANVPAEAVLRSHRTQSWTEVLQ